MSPKALRRSTRSARKRNPTRASLSPSPPKSSKKQRNTKKTPSTARGAATHNKDATPIFDKKPAAVCAKVTKKAAASASKGTENAAPASTQKRTKRPPLEHTEFVIGKIVYNLSVNHQTFNKYSLRNYKKNDNDKLFLISLNGKRVVTTKDKMSKEVKKSIEKKAVLFLVALLTKYPRMHPEAAKTALIDHLNSLYVFGTEDNTSGPEEYLDLDDMLSQTNQQLHPPVEAESTDAMATDQGHENNGNLASRVATLESQHSSHGSDINKLTAFHMQMGNAMGNALEKQGEQFGNLIVQQGDQLGNRINQQGEQIVQQGQQIVQQGEQLGERITQQGELIVQQGEQLGERIGQNSDRISNNEGRLDVHDWQIADRPTYAEAEASAKKIVDESGEKWKSEVLDSISKMAAFSGSDNKMPPGGPTQSMFAAVSSKAPETKEYNDTKAPEPKEYGSTTKAPEPKAYGGTTKAPEPKAYGGTTKSPEPKEYGDTTKAPEPKEYGDAKAPETKEYGDSAKAPELKEYEDTKPSPVSLDPTLGGSADTGHVLKAAPSILGTPQKDPPSFMETPQKDTTLRSATPRKNTKVRFAAEVSVKYHKHTLSPALTPFNKVPLALGSPTGDGVEPLNIDEPPSIEKTPHIPSKDAKRSLRFHGMSKQEIRKELSDINAANQLEQLEESASADLEEEERLLQELPWNCKLDGMSGAIDEDDVKSPTKAEPAGKHEEGKSLHNAEPTGEHDKGDLLGAAKEEGTHPEPAGDHEEGGLLESPRNPKPAGEHDNNALSVSAEEEGESPRGAKRQKTSHSVMGTVAGLLWGRSKN